MAANRLGAFRTILTAMRTATRPGSPAIGARLSSLPRLVRATFRGEYTGTTKGRLLAVLGALVYVVSPVDLVPEALLPLLGLADDAVVLSWIAAALVNETESFLAWERSRGMGSAAHGARQDRPDPQDTVRGSVIR